MSTHSVYATVDEVKRAIGNQNSSGTEDRVVLALIVASRWVDYHVGRSTAADLDTNLVPPYEVEVVPRPAGQVLATLAAATYLHGSPDRVLVGDIRALVTTSIPDAAFHLLGQRQAWGIV